MTNAIIHKGNVHEEIKERMDKQIDKAQTVCLVLRATVNSLSQTVIADNEHRTAFQLRLNEFLANKEKSFDQVAERICEAEHKLSVVTKQLEESNQRYHELLDRQEQQIIRLEQIDAACSEETVESFDEVCKASINGFYAVKKEEPLRSAPNHGAALKAVVKSST